MKYKIIGKKIKKNCKKYDHKWIDKLDGKIVEFKDDEILAKCGMFFVSKYWCEPIENVSHEIICDNKYIIKKIKEYCKSNIKRIDDMKDAGYSTDFDNAIYYVYCRILGIIERGDDND